MCNQFYISIINSGLTPRGQKFEQQTDVILHACGSHEQRTQTKILIQSTWKHRVMHNTCIKHGRNIKNTVYWVDFKLAQKKGLKFYQTRSNAIILYNILPAYCIPKVVRMETGEVAYEKVYASPRPPLKISFRHAWMKDLG